MINRRKIVKEAERGSSASMPTKPTFSHVTGGVRVRSILPNNYPEVLQTTEQMRFVRKTILDTKSENKAATKPHFHSLHNRPGWVLMCADDTNKPWLESNI
ncbi:hypothetical protein JTB14_003238 [Gonioctena quinquepunctata]|nr:hypothetical protein JTB14_003238 [Gonioctena quinquepunctata]